MDPSILDRHRSNKVYAVHALEVECIPKGKAQKTVRIRLQSIDSHIIQKQLGFYYANTGFKEIFTAKSITSNSLKQNLPTTESFNLQKPAFSATPQLDVALAWELGLAFAIENITITLDMRFTYNFTLSKEYFERIDASADYTHVDIQAAYSLDGRILLGVGYIFEFKK